MRITEVLTEQELSELDLAQAGRSVGRAVGKTAQTVGGIAGGVAGGINAFKSGFRSGKAFVGGQRVGQRDQYQDADDVATAAQRMPPARAPLTLPPEEPIANANFKDLGKHSTGHPILPGDKFDAGTGKPLAKVAPPATQTTQEPAHAPTSGAQSTVAAAKQFQQTTGNTAILRDKAMAAMKKPEFQRTFSDRADIKAAQDAGIKLTASESLNSLASDIAYSRFLGRDL